MYGIIHKPQIDIFKPRVIKTSIEYGALLDDNNKITHESLAYWLFGDTDKAYRFFEVDAAHLTMKYHFVVNARTPYERKEMLKKLTKRIQRIVSDVVYVNADGGIS